MFTVIIITEQCEERELTVILSKAELLIHQKKLTKFKLPTICGSRM